MITSNHQALYLAHELTRLRAADGIGRLSQSLFDACVDLNPHQIDAALFASRSPASKGVLLPTRWGWEKPSKPGCCCASSGPSASAA